MLSARSVRLLLCLFLLMNYVTAPAQRRAKLDCPRPVRQHAYRPAPKAYLEIGAGLSKPLLYRNGAGGAGEHYRFSSRVSPYATAVGYIVLSERLEAFAGAAITQTWQGLHFSYADGGNSTTVKSYAGTLVVSVPVGIRYRAGSGLALSAGPYIAYTSHTGNGQRSGSSGGSSRSYYTYDAPDDKHRMAGGIRLAADIRITKRLGAVLSCSADAGRSAVSYGTADLSDQGNGVYKGAMEPYLLHAGLGLSYKLWSRED